MTSQDTGMSGIKVGTTRRSASKVDLTRFYQVVNKDEGAKEANKEFRNLAKEPRKKGTRQRATKTRKTKGAEASKSAPVVQVASDPTWRAPLKCVPLAEARQGSGSQ
ncbi:hypothetical protein PC110_g9124 [Phytophthora cactorum]|uniref:Uncharacterized protein n=2 Tax=Phytophthora cactorum TaxID=29920 RepID=A0A329SCQ2_9STRA|nr:hypothetical protein PC110_g9124 [Phytophthora cactorum]